MLRTISLLIFSLILFFLYAQKLHAGGFQLYEHSVTGLGRAFAGSGIAGDDLSDMFYNPAGLMLRDKRQIQIGANFIMPELSFQDQGSTLDFGFGALPISGDTSVDPGDNALVPNLYYKMDISDTLKFGLSITSPFGLTTDYGNNWTGRYHTTTSELLTVDINSSFAYQLNEQVILGIGFSLVSADADISQAIFTGPTSTDGLLRIEGDDLALAYTLGTIITVSDRTRLGLSMRSNIDLTFEGNLAISGTGASDTQENAHAEINLPENIYLSFSNQIKPKWQLLASAQWTKWSRFDELLIIADSGPLPAERQDWNNVWTYNLGINYSYSKKWTLRAGWAAEKSPIPSNELHRPGYSGSDNNWITLGASYKPSENLSIDFAYANIKFKEATANVTNDLISLTPSIEPNILQGRYKWSANTIGVQVVYQLD